MTRNTRFIDGLVRDTKKNGELQFPVYCGGIKPVDSRSRGMVVDYNCSVNVGGVIVHPGDECSDITDFMTAATLMIISGYEWDDAMSAIWDMVKRVKKLVKVGIYLMYN